MKTISQVELISVLAVLEWANTQKDILKKLEKTQVVEAYMKENKERIKNAKSSRPSKVKNPITSTVFTKKVVNFLKGALAKVNQEQSLARGMKIKQWLKSGEFEGTEKDTKAVITSAGQMLDSASTPEILGTNLFEGSDGRYYTVTVEAVISEASEEFSSDILQELQDEENEADLSGAEAAEKEAYAGRAKKEFGFTPDPKCDNCDGTGFFAFPEEGGKGGDSPGEPCAFCQEEAIKRGEINGAIDGVHYKGGMIVNPPEPHYGSSTIVPSLLATGKFPAEEEKNKPGESSPMSPAVAKKIDDLEKKIVSEADKSILKDAAKIRKIVAEVRGSLSIPDSEIESAWSEYGGWKLPDLENELSVARRRFTEAGGRSVELAEKVDRTSMVLELRKAGVATVEVLEDARDIEAVDEACDAVDAGFGNFTSPALSEQAATVAGVALERPVGVAELKDAWSDFGDWELNTLRDHQKKLSEKLGHAMGMGEDTRDELAKVTIVVAVKAWLPTLEGKKDVLADEPSVPAEAGS